MAELVALVQRSRRPDGSPGASSKPWLYQKAALKQSCTCLGSAVEPLSEALPIKATSDADAFVVAFSSAPPGDDAPPPVVSHYGLVTGEEFNKLLGEFETHVQRHIEVAAAAAAEAAASTIAGDLAALASAAARAEEGQKAAVSALRAKVQQLEQQLGSGRVEASPPASKGVLGVAAGVAAAAQGVLGSLAPDHGHSDAGGLEATLETLRASQASQLERLAALERRIEEAMADTMAVSTNTAVVSTEATPLLKRTDHAHGLEPNELDRGNAKNTADSWRLIELEEHGMKVDDRLDRVELVIERLKQDTSELFVKGFVSI